MTQGLQIAVEGGQEISHDVLQRTCLFGGNESSFVCPPEKVAGFVQRSARNANEPLVIGRRSPAVAFRNVCPHTVGGAHDLLTNRRSGELVPGPRDVPSQIGQLFGQRINFQTIQGEFRHVPMS